jgi:hypothetical protein
VLIELDHFLTGSGFELRAEVPVDLVEYLAVPFECFGKSRAQPAHCGCPTQIVAGRLCNTLRSRDKGRTPGDGASAQQRTAFWTARPKTTA